ncbi:MAG: TIGR00153 family protein [Gemmatimonadetes bacterium]|jgi:predicted phosphate transport protein (TIGR00153 family)|nr:TIGR00153 family protein [Gemmatimonadota bacterium]
MRSVFGIFGRSPFGPLAKHTERVHETVAMIRPLMEAFMAGEWERAEQLYQQISKLEHKADVVKDEIRDHLPRSLLLPVDRGDLLKFLREQDAIADRAEDLAVLVTMRRTPTAPAMRESTLALVDQVIRTSETWYSIAMDLPLLQSASFSGPEADRIRRLIERVGREEWEADKAQSLVSKQLFEHEEELGAVSVVMWMRILATIGLVANHAENSADLLRLMMTRD